MSTLIADPLAHENNLHYRLLEYAATLPRPATNPDLYGLNGLYLSRWVIHDFPEDRSQLRLHHIVRPDEDEELHDHPWGDKRCRQASTDHPWPRASAALILFGGYEEERRQGNAKNWRIVRRRYMPGDLNVLYSDDFHRIDRLFNDLGSWSIFWTGPKTKSWQFWNRITNIYTPWRAFNDAKWRPATEAT